ncbi:MAG: L-aspartate oxidase [Bdellovibrionales bacterium]
MGGPAIIIGAGLAGLSVALAAAPKPVIVLGRKLEEALTSSALAQGGIAAAVGADDSLDLHVQDTLQAGAGLCDEAAVRSIINDGPHAIETLLSWGIPFDRDNAGALACGLEGAHSRRRVVHAGCDSTGAAIMAVLVKKMKATPSITFFDDAEAKEIKTEEGRIRAVVFTRQGRSHEIETDQVVVATGSACALWRESTVPSLSWGQGLLLAARAGAVLRDLEFIQFHPTALHVGRSPMPLLSEALRGEGAMLVTEEGERFVDELAPRDVVARAIFAQQQKGHKVYLDVRNIKNFRERFSTISEICSRFALDPMKDLLPITPVAHYHMGGIATDMDGKTVVEGLYACGECASTGLQGANRLASNSLLEAVVMGLRVAKNLKEADADFSVRACNSSFTPSDEAADKEVQNILANYAGLVRDAEGLARAEVLLAALASDSDRAVLAQMIVRAALKRTESRGGHYRSDYPDPDPAQVVSSCIDMQDFLFSPQEDVKKHDEIIRHTN